MVLAACGAPRNTNGVITAFTVDKATIRPGESATLRWTTTGADDCVLTPGNQMLATNGSTTVTPTADTTYRLTCSGASKTLAVHVRDGGSIDSFTASATEVAPDTLITLSWATTSTRGCSIQPVVGSVAASGTVSLRVTATGTFTLLCATDQEAVSADVTVTVTPVTSLDPPANVALTPHDGYLTVSWEQPQGATNVYLAAATGIEPATVASLPEGIALRKVTSPLVLGGLTNGRAYSVVLTATSGTVVSAPSPEVTATPVAGAPLGDPLYADQWHLNGSKPSHIDVGGAWAQGIKGDGVKVAVVDEGFDPEHEDLAANSAVGRHKDYGVNTPVSYAEHGTCVAGIIAARDENGLGVRGGAPHAQIRSFNLLQSNSSSAMLDAMRRDKDEVSLSNNSWGYGMNTGVLIERDALWEQGVSEGTSTGRGGKGIVYLFASGNGGDPTIGNTDNSNFSFTSNTHYTMAIGGVGPDDTRPSYAVPGATVLVAGPTQGDNFSSGGIVTTDLPGNDGYNRDGNTTNYSDRGYTNDFNGTSAATPMVAGVVALVLQARPELTYRDVRRVLALSARKADATSTNWQTNAAGLPVNHDFGFGEVDATAAVNLAKTIPLVGPEVTLETPWKDVNVTVPDFGDAVRSSIDVSGSGIGHIEFIEIEVDIDIPSSGDLELILERNGSVSDLLHPTHNCGNFCTPINHFSFGSVRHLEEAADGRWTLAVRDRRTPGTGTFKGWSLRFFGRQ